MADIEAIDLSVNDYNATDHAIVFFNKTTGEVFRFSPDFSGGGGGGGALTRANFIDMLAHGYLGQMIYNFAQSGIGSVMSIDCNFLPNLGPLKVAKLAFPYNLYTSAGNPDTGGEFFNFSDQYGITFNFPAILTTGNLSLVSRAESVNTTFGTTGANVLDTHQMKLSMMLETPFVGVSGGQARVDIQITEDTEYYINLYYDSTVGPNWMLFWENADGDSGDDIDTTIAFNEGHTWAAIYQRERQPDGTYTITVNIKDETIDNIVYTQTGNTNVAGSAGGSMSIAFQKKAGTEAMIGYVPRLDSFVTLVTV